MIAPRAVDPEQIAVLFEVPLHIIVGPDAIPLGYWRRQESRDIARRRLVTRVRRLLRR